MSKSKSSLFTNNLFLRVMSALVLIPVVLGSVWVGDWLFYPLIIVVSMLGLAEWMALTAPKLPQRGKIGTQIALFFVFFVALSKGIGAGVILSVLAAVLLGYYAGLTKGKVTKSHRLWVALGVPYLAWSGLALLHLRDMPEHGLFLIVYLLLVVWGTDTGAYFAGRLIGGPKLLPQISPKKTWAGLIGGMACAAAFGYGAAHGFGESSPAAFAALGAIMAIVSQAGDFFESFVKRRAGAKDSGSLIPGHGGILDRVDGLLFAAVFLGLISFFFK